MWRFLVILSLLIGRVSFADGIEKCLRIIPRVYEIVNKALFIDDPLYVFLNSKHLKGSFEWDPGTEIKEAQDIAIISDGEHAIQGRRIAAEFPNKNIVSTNVSNFNFLKNMFWANNHKAVKSDNTDKIKLPDNSQDLILMRRGLCLCKSQYQCCAGFDLGTKHAKNFFSEIARILKDDGRAFLQGSYGMTTTHVEKMDAYLKELRVEYPNLKWAILKDKDNNFFDGLVIYKGEIEETSIKEEGGAPIEHSSD